MYVSIGRQPKAVPSLVDRGQFILVGMMALLLSLLVTSGAGADSLVDDPSAVVDTLLIHVEPLDDRATLDTALAQHAMTLGRVWPEFGLAEVRLTPSQDSVGAASADALDVAQRFLESVPGVQRAETDGQVLAAGHSQLPGSQSDWPDSRLGQSTETPTDSLNGEQWVHGRLGVFDSWNISRGSPVVAIAVIDSGYDLAHEDISPGSMWVNAVEQDGEPGIDDDRNGFVDDLHGWDWIENDDVANDPYGHGTHVGGAIAADTNNALGISSLSPGLRILPLRVLDGQGAGQISDLIDALYYAHQQKIPVVNMSLVIQINSDALQTAVQAAARGGMVLVAASGNHATAVSWPAKYAETVAVAATDLNDRRGPFSNFGSEIEVAAPGVDILSTYRDNGYHRLSGTSMAAAHVSALAGLIRGLRPDLSADELRTIMRETARDVNAATLPGDDDYLGAGRIDFYAALYRASAELAVSPLATIPVMAHAGESTVMQVAVAAGKEETLAVDGAVVQFQLLPALPSADSGEAEAEVGQVATNADGVARIVFPAPDDEGEYVLRLRVGVAAYDLPVEVIERLATVELTQPGGDMVVGDEDVPLQLDLRDGDGQSIAGDATIHLETDMGGFDNGRTEMDLTVRDGQQTIRFRPGRVAGTATLTIQLGRTVQEQRLDIQPGDAAQIALAAAVDPVDNRTTVSSAPIVLSIEDRYGNPVADGTSVRLVADRGVLATGQLISQAGSVATTLSVPSGISGPANIWALVPGTRAELQIEVPLMNAAYWFPIIAAD